MDSPIAEEKGALSFRHHSSTPALLLRRIDLYLLPLLCITYGLQASDKTSLSYGVNFGLVTDTHLVGQQYAWLGTLFYVGYMLAELPMSIAMQRFPLAKHSPPMNAKQSIVAWGALVMLLGACTNFAQLAFLRFLIGTMESAVTPGFLLLVTSWYTREETTSRSLIWMMMPTVVSAIFALFNYAIAKHIEQYGGLAPWRAINLFLGACTVVHGFVLLGLLGTPDEVHWLSEEQKQAAKERIVLNGTGSAGKQEWNWDQVLECFRDPQVWCLLVFNLIATVPSGALSTFSPLLMASFGFTPLQIVLYGLPTSAFLLLFFLFTAVIVKRYPGSRFLLMTLSPLPPLAGLLSIVLLPRHSSKWLKFGLFHMLSTFPISTFLAWTLYPLNMAGRTKKTVVGAMTFIAYCIGQMSGTQAFQASDAPHYKKGLLVVSCAFGTQVLVAITWKLYYTLENGRRDKVQLAAGISEEETKLMNLRAGETDATDLQNLSFRYVC
ncbi:major facilitator superfamily domain-containing protein [Mycena amicta]|nr:major facilitator superfamily domain-containing protein [Mycena amicta]